MFDKKIKKPEESKPKNNSIRPMLMTIVLLLLQVAVFVMLITVLNEYAAAFSFGLLFISLVMTILVITSDTKSAYKIAWILPIVAMPVFGMMLYILIKVLPGTKNLVNRLEELMEQSSPYLPQNKDVLSRFDIVDEHYGDLCKMLYSSGYYPVYKNVDSVYYNSGETAFEAIKEELSKAKKYIFIEFFIVKKGKMLSEILEILTKKVNEGVEVRFMYDGTNLISQPWDYDEYIKSLGIQCKIFSKPIPILSSYHNNRDHRKIVVVDGKVAITGGINIADEYINEQVRFGHWKDCAIKFNTDAVRTFTASFLQMWNLDEKGKAQEDFAKFLSRENTPLVKTQTKNFFIPYADYPDSYDNPAEAVYLHLLFFAKKYVYIMSPYLVIDDDFLLAMKFAAKRGVTIKLIIPGIPDKRIPYEVAHSYLPDLIKTGIEVYLYTPGFVHSKVFLCDDIAATVGTVNLDFRSMYLHFENGVLAYDPKLAMSIKEDFEETLLVCSRVDESYYKSMPIWRKAFGKFFRMFAPIM